jgi:hypothetical protein
VKVAIGLALGACAAVVVACGASQKAAMPVSAETSTAGVAPTMAPGDQRERIDALDAEITASFVQLGVERPAPAAMPALGCSPGVDCSPQTMSTGIEAPRADTTCKPGSSDVCDTSCTLADSVCSNAEKICTIAGELGGGDEYANEKCDSGKSACDRASERCCSCM